MELTKINITKAKRLFAQGNNIVLISEGKKGLYNTVTVNNKDDMIDDFNKFINSFYYYNCPTGYKLSYYIES